MKQQNNKALARILRLKNQLVKAQGMKSSALQDQARGRCSGCGASAEIECDCDAK